MNLTSKNILSVFFLIPIISCSSLNSARSLTDEQSKNLQDIREKRVKSISQGDTIYSDSLRCLDDNFFSTSAIIKSAGKIDISAAKIIDKTGKIYGTVSAGQPSTALSDMVLHSLTKFNDSFEVVDTPLGSFRDSRINILAPKNPGGSNLGGVDISTLDQLPIGAIYPLHSYFSGAIVHYDESSELPSDGTGITIEYPPVYLSNDVEVINVGVHLRFMNADTGRIVNDGSVLLTNRLLTANQGANIFRVINSDNRELNYNVTTSDPQHYAVMEILERGIYEILSNVISGVIGDKIEAKKLIDQKCSPFNSEV